MQNESADRLLVAQLLLSFVADKTTFKSRMAKLLHELGKTSKKPEVTQEIIDVLGLEKP